MTIFVGDIHGEFEIFNRLLNRDGVFDYPESIIQVGDFGHHPAWLKYRPFVAPPRKIYWIDGNHEFFPDIFGDSMFTKYSSPHTTLLEKQVRPPRPEITEPTELYTNCIYIPRGTVMEIDGRVMGFLGGGDSIDKQYRHKGYDWFPEERITVAQVDRLIENAKGKKVEVLVTHVPPYYLTPMILLSHHGGNMSPEANYCNWMVERAWNALGRPTLVCGHFHTSFRHENVHVLDINEFKEV